MNYRNHPWPAANIFRNRKLPVRRNLSAFILAVMLAAAPAAAAETVYISDVLIVSLRSSTDSNAETLTNFKTDTPLELLAMAGDFVKVRGPEGKEGYIHQQYVSTKTPKPIIIARLRQQLAEADNANLQDKQELLEQLAKTSSALAAAEGNLQLLHGMKDAQEGQLQEVRRKLQEKTVALENLQKNAANVVTLAQENEALQKAVGQLRKELQQITRDDIGLFESRFIRWLAAGAGFFFAGWLLGRICRRNVPKY